MATIQIADDDARVQYTQAVVANTTQLTIDYPFFSLDDINVIVTNAAGTDTVLTRGTGTGTFAVVGTAVDDGFSGGYITLGDDYSAGTDTFTIFRDIPVQRTTDFPTSGPFNISSLNTELDKIIAIEQELETKVTRTLQLADSDTTIDLKLPNLDTRKGTTLAFNATTGVPEAGPSISGVTTVAALAADIATLADIEDGTVATDSISDTAAIAGNVTTVANISGNVTTVAGISTQITDVAADATDIGTVAADLAGSDNIGTVATNISDVNTVATNIADVITVANDLNEAISEIETAALDLQEATSEIDVVANAITNVDFVGNDIANVNLVAGQISPKNNISTVAGLNSEITTVAGDSAEINTVAGDSADIGTLALISGDITSVANISGDVTTVANDATDIGLVATDIGNVNTVAGSIGDVNSFADTYFISASAPSSPTVGDLWYDTVSTELKYYNGSVWGATSTSVNGTADRSSYVATAGQTTFSATYDVGYVDVYLNGVKLVNTTDFTATNGSSVVLTTGAALNDTVEIIGFGSFQVSVPYVFQGHSPTVPFDFNGSGSRTAQDGLEYLQHASGSLAGRPNSDSWKAPWSNNTNFKMTLHEGNALDALSGGLYDDGDTFTLGNFDSSNLMKWGIGVTGKTSYFKFEETNIYSDIKMATGYGIYLGGTGASNYIDDYEEGTWTPSDNSGAGLSFTVANATYTKVGRLVTVHADITYPSTADVSSNSISGLPFALRADDYAGSIGLSEENTVSSVLGDASASTLSIRNSSGAQITNDTLSGDRLVFNITYEV